MEEDVFDWSIRRSGAGLTIRGKTATGEPRSVAGIQMVYADRLGVLAVGKAGRKVRLQPRAA